MSNDSVCYKRKFVFIILTLIPVHRSLDLMVSRTWYWS